MKTMLNKRKLVNSKDRRSISAFTLIELILVVLIIAVLTSIVSISLSNLVPRANLTTTTEILLAEIRQQQLRSMNKEKNEVQQASEYGIFIEQQQYTLFTGSTFDENNPNNLITEIPLPLELSTNFPNQVIVFAQGNGEILNFMENQNTISVVDTNDNRTKTLNLNSYGVPE